jgi:hypothetical protein
MNRRLLQIAGAVGLALVALVAAFTLGHSGSRESAAQNRPRASVPDQLPAADSAPVSTPPAPELEPVAPAAPEPPAEPALSPREKLAVALRDYRQASDDEDRTKAISEIADLGREDGGLDPEEAASALGGLFYAAPDATLKADLLVHLGSLETPAALEPILAGLRPNQPVEVRMAALAASGILGDKRALGSIRPLTVDRNPAVAEAAKAAIEEIDAPLE